jgi:hypothetical protein
MVKCSKAQIRQLKTALRWKIPTAASAQPDGIAARERDGAACDCSGHGCLAEHGEPGSH